MFAKMIKRALFSIMLGVSVIGAFTVSGGIAVSHAAATHFVSAYDDLLSAISCAQSGDTIEIAADIVVLEELSIDKTLSVNGNGHTISVPVPGLDDSGTLNAGASKFRVFNLISGTLTINNATIKGGAAENAGSAIFVNAGAVLKLNTVTVSNSGGVAREGGGIANYGTAYLYNCNIIRNGASYGGGFLNINSAAKMFVENCSFSENRSLSSNGGGGAGENKGSAQLYVNNSTFSNNKSTELGGAINNYNGIAYILNSTFTGNVNYNSSVSGGALRISGQVYLINDIFAYNYSSSDNGESYSLNDFYNSPTAAYYCILHGSMTAGAGNVQYTGLNDGSDNSLFTGGSTSKVLAANGMEMGTATIYQPYLARIAGSATTSVPLQPNRDAALCAGIETGFTNGGGNPAAGYRDPVTDEWVTLTGGDAASAKVAFDQNGGARDAVPTKGAVETTIEKLFMIKVNAAAGGIIRGGTVYGDTYASGAPVTLTAIPFDGYKFLRWTDVSDFNTLSNANPYTFTVLKSQTIAPVFEALAEGEYIVTYVGNGNTGGTVPSSQAYTAPATISGNTGHLTRTGYLFTGWNTRANGSGTGYAAGDIYSLGANLTLYAQWERILFTVNFDSQGGGGVPSAIAGCGDTITAPADPTKEGWNFGGWYRESGCLNVWNFAADTVNENITLYAKWTPIPVTFDGGTLPEGTYNTSYCVSVEAFDGSGSFIYELVLGALPAGFELSSDGKITGTPTVPGNNTFTIKATDTINGETAAAEFTLKIATLGTLAAPYAAPASGGIDYGDSVELATTTPNAAIRYTVNGDTPTADSTLYTGAITLYADTTIKAVAIKAGWNNSDVSVQSYTIKTYKVSYDGNGATGGDAPVDLAA
ncbi:MAG: InlB B-repeat-containing protein, partial [Christensenellales bacterium]